MFYSVFLEIKLWQPSDRFWRSEIRLATDFCDVAQPLYKSWFGHKFDLLRRLPRDQNVNITKDVCKKSPPWPHERLSGGDFLHTSLVILTCWFLAPYGGGDFLHTSTAFLMKMQCSTIQMAPQKHQLFNISQENKAKSHTRKS